MPRCHTDGEAGFSWLAFAPSLSFPVSRPPHGFSSHPIPLHRTAIFFFFNTNFPFQPPTVRAVSHAGPAQRHGVGVSGPRSSPRFQESGTHSPLTSSDRPGPDLLLHPAGSFPLPPLAAPAHPPGRPDPESPQPRREQRRRLLPLPAQNLADPLPGARRRGRPGWRPAPGSPPRTEHRSVPCSCPRRPGWGPSSV